MKNIFWHSGEGKWKIKFLNKINLCVGVLEQAYLTLCLRSDMIYFDLLFGMSLLCKYFVSFKNIYRMRVF